MLPKDKSKIEEHREKLREAARNRVFTRERREKMSKSMKGKPFTEEHRRNLAEANRRRAAQTPSKKIKTTCDYCGKEIECYPSELKKCQNHYCSHNCSSKARIGKKMKYKNGDKHPNYGIQRSEEVRKKIKEAQLGREFSEEHRRKISDSRKKEPITVECPLCHKFFEMSQSEFKRGGKYCSRECMVESEEWRKLISESKIGHVESEETRKKKSESHKGEKNHNYGKPLGEEIKKKLSESKKKLVGVLSPRWGATHTIETRMKISSLLSGEKHPNWRGGVSFEPYCEKFNEDLKERVRMFFGNVCALCGKTEEENGKKLAVHHVYAEKKACCEGDICNLNEMDELRKQFPKEIANFGNPNFTDEELIRVRMMVPLCHSCHSKTMSKRNAAYYMQFFDDLIMTKYGGKCYYTKEEYSKIINSTYDDTTIAHDRTCKTAQIQS